jgi:hypothetical protein
MLEKYLFGEFIDLFPISEFLKSEWSSVRFDSRGLDKISILFELESENQISIYERSGTDYLFTFLIHIDYDKETLSRVRDDIVFDFDSEETYEETPEKLNEEFLEWLNDLCSCTFDPVKGTKKVDGVLIEYGIGSVVD